ncbi:MAG TPA: hypothetical protein VIA80_01605 [Hyphomonadaceae bacterium]|jgi:hypothetical protein
MFTLGAGLLGVGLVIVSVLGVFSLAAGDLNAVAISAEIFWFAIAAIVGGLFFIGIGVWRHFHSIRADNARLLRPREDWGRRPQP